MGLPPLFVAPTLMLTVLGEAPAVATTPVGTPGTVAPLPFGSEPSDAVEASIATPASEVSSDEGRGSASTNKSPESTLAASLSSLVSPLDDEQPAKIASTRMIAV
jgi:hypothetical protein